MWDRVWGEIDVTPKFVIFPFLSHKGSLGNDMPALTISTDRTCSQLSFEKKMLRLSIQVIQRFPKIYNISIVLKSKVQPHRKHWSFCPIVSQNLMFFSVT